MDSEAVVADLSAETAVDPFVALAVAHEGVAGVGAADMAGVDGEWLARFGQSINELLSQTQALAVAFAAEVERRGHDRRHGFTSTKRWLQHFLQLSGPEAHARIQITAVFDLLPVWGTAARAGEVGVDQVKSMARVAANPRLHDALTADDCELGWELLADAIVLPYDRFEARLRMFERLADPDGAADASARHHHNRDVTMRQRPDGSWRLTGQFASVQGAEINEILAHFNQAEWDTDWAGARADNGDGDGELTVADLCRSEANRRADALYHALTAGATAPADARQPLPTLNVLIDETTLHDVVIGTTPPVERFRDVVCRTQSGHDLDLTDAAAIALWGHIRRVVHNSADVIVNMGRKSRLFTGSAREAALLLHAYCIWPGCNRPITACQVDHAIAWRHHGTTDNDNADPLCHTHHPLKETGNYSIRRMPDGTWITFDTDHNPIGWY
jgi:hypothetical protein